MNIAYFSVTGQVKRFTKKLSLSSFDISEHPDTDEKFILVVPTYEPEITFPADDFMADNYQNCLGILGSGNRNFGHDFVYTAKDLSKKYKVPLLYSFEFNGTEEDIQNVLNIINQLN